MKRLLLVISALSEQLRLIDLHAALAVSVIRSPSADRLAAGELFVSNEPPVSCRRATSTTR